MKIPKIILFNIVVIACQFIAPGLNYAQTSEIVRELALERAKEKKPTLETVKKDQVKKPEKLKLAKPLIKTKQPKVEEIKPVSRKSNMGLEEPRMAQESNALDKELKDWLGKLKTIESVLP
ncbi:MAG: hypothetical protein ABIH27_05930 [Candidatus Omnitrophota bacterium]